MCDVVQHGGEGRTVESISYQCQLWIQLSRALFSPSTLKQLAQQNTTQDRTTNTDTTTQFNIIHSLIIAREVLILTLSILHVLQDLMGDFGKY